MDCTGKFMIKFVCTEVGRYVTTMEDTCDILDARWLTFVMGYSYQTKA